MNALHDNTLHTPKRSGTARRLRWILGLGGVLIALAAAYVHFYLYLPTGSGPAGPTVARAPFEMQ